MTICWAATYTNPLPHSTEPRRPHNSEPCRRRRDFIERHSAPLCIWWQSEPGTQRKKVIKLLYTARSKCLNRSRPVIEHWSDFTGVLQVKRWQLAQKCQWWIIVSRVHGIQQHTCRSRTTTRWTSLKQMHTSRIKLCRCESASSNRDRRPSPLQRKIYR